MVIAFVTVGYQRVTKTYRECVAARTGLIR
jgi:hypothetical protein